MEENHTLAEIYKIFKEELNMRDNSDRIKILKEEDAPLILITNYEREWNERRYHDAENNRYFMSFDRQLDRLMIIESTPCEHGCYKHYIDIRKIDGKFKFFSRDDLPEDILNAKDKMFKHFKGIAALYDAIFGSKEKSE